MPPHRLLLMAGAGWLLAASAAQAISFGRPPASVALGSTLDLVLPVRLEADEVLEPECVSAELTIGDRRVPPHNLRWAVESGSGPLDRQIRVMSMVVVDEPVVTVQINTGCSLRMSRRFTAFADPPLGGAAGPVGPAAPTAIAADPRDGAGGAGAAPRRAAAASAAAAQDAAPPARPAARPARRGAAPTRPSRERPATADARPAASVAPRLSLESPDPALLRQAMAAAIAEQQASAAQAAEAASAAAAAAASAAARVQALEQQVQRLLDEGRRQREELQQLRAQAARQSAAERWLPWMGALLAMALALAAWLGLRLRRLQRDAQTRWWADAAEVLADARPDPQPAAQAAPAPGRGGATAGHSGQPSATGPRSAAAAAAPMELDLTLPGATDEVETAVGPVTVEPEWSRTAPPPRAVSADELIDLEQQAEFFVVLGQDEAAIDLLVGHLRDSGGTSPLPYLKLLEIYRRRGEREAYDRTRERFNQRFNAYAPDWDTDMQQGRVLADYLQVLMRLQSAWASPIDAMAELQTLLFRTDEGELFDLPAYREVLLLYSVARDLYDHEAREAAPDVDVLLPLQTTGFGTTEPMPDATMVGEATIVLTPELRLEGPTQYHAVDLDLGPAPATPKPKRR